MRRLGPPVRPQCLPPPATLLDEGVQLTAAWAAAPSPTTAEALATHLERIDALLRAHLADEETLVIPVIEEVFTAAEWEEISAHAQQSTARAHVFLFFGLIQDGMSREQAAEMMASVPLIVRVLYRLLGRRQYAAKIDLLSAGTAKAEPYAA